MPSKLFQSPRVDTPTIIDASINVSAGTASLLATILGTMKALSESHRVLENLLLLAYQKSQALPLSTDEKCSILFLVLFAVYCFVVYPLLVCPTRDVPGPYITATLVGYRVWYWKKGRDEGDQWALELHRTYGPVVRLTPTLVSVNDPNSLPKSQIAASQLNSKLGSTSSNGSRESSFANSIQTRSSIASASELTRNTKLHPFDSTIWAVVTDLRLAMRGQKTVDIHDLLSRHLHDRAPASFALALAHTVYQLAHPFHRHYLNQLARQLVVEDSTSETEEAETSKLLDAVVKESLRMQQAPNHHAITFVALGNGLMIGDYIIERGTEVSTSLYSVCRNPATFERPNDYHPNRWLEATKESTHMDDSLNVVLDYHRAIKPGFDITLERLKILLSEILRSFDMRLPLGEQPKQLGAISLKTGGCRVRFRVRKQAVEKKVRFAEHIIM